MKKILVLSLFLASLSTLAQDVIVLKGGSTIISKVYEVNKSEIKYKKHSNLNGPQYTIRIKDVMSIDYENGEKDLFDKKIEKQKEKKTEQAQINNSAKPKNSFMYSNISLGYAKFDVSHPYEIDYFNFHTNGFALEYIFGIKPFKKNPLYTEIGANITSTFEQETNKFDVTKINTYFSFKIPLNIKYIYSLPNSKWKISPFIGLYFKYNIIAKQNLFSLDVSTDYGSTDIENTINYIDGSYKTKYFKYGIVETDDWFKFKKEQFGWQVGLGIEYNKISLSGYYSRDFQPVTVPDKNLIYDRCFGSQFGVSLDYRFDM
jgi:opacity protein-like surface antigen